MKDSGKYLRNIWKKLGVNPNFLILSISLVIPYCLPAHPHIFIDNTVTIVFDNNGLAGIQVKWIFDEMYSTAITHDFDENKDGTFSDTEIEKIKQEAFSNLEDYDYFTHIVINGKKFKVKYVKDFSAHLSENRVVYNFFIPCHVSAISSYKEIKISMYDITYYVSISLADENPVRFKNTSHVDFTYRVFEDTKNAYYYGQVFPHAILLKFREKK